VGLIERRLAEINGRGRACPKRTVAIKIVRKEVIESDEAVISSRERSGAEHISNRRYTARLLIVGTQPKKLDYFITTR
jgi:hypothetical protein